MIGATTGEVVGRWVGDVEDGACVTGAITGEAVGRIVGNFDEGTGVRTKAPVGVKVRNVGVGSGAKVGR